MGAQSPLLLVPHWHPPCTSGVRECRAAGVRGGCVCAGMPGPGSITPGQESTALRSSSFSFFQKSAVSSKLPAAVR